MEQEIRLRTLGTTGVRVSELCLGAMMFGALGNRDHADCIRIINEALDAGINFIDTADIYSRGESEEIVGAAIAGRRDEIVLATKFNGAMEDRPNHAGNSRRWIVAEVERSLRRLRTDHLDLYQAHRPDPTADLDDTLSTLTDLVRSGKVRYAGCSTFPAEWIVESHWISERRGYEHFRTEQPPYSLFAREAERAVLPTCQRHGMGALVWSPLNGGWLTGRLPTDDAIAASPRARRAPDRYDLTQEANRRKAAALAELGPLAADLGTDIIGLALSFVLNHPAVTSAIVGPRTMEQLQGILASPRLTLPKDVLDRIDEIVPPGESLAQIDRGYIPPELASWRRRRGEVRV